MTQNNENGSNSGQFTTTNPSNQTESLQTTPKSRNSSPQTSSRPNSPTESVNSANLTSPISISHRNKSLLAPPIVTETHSYSDSPGGLRGLENPSMGSVGSSGMGDLDMKSRNGTEAEMIADRRMGETEMIAERTETPAPDGTEAESIYSLGSVDPTVFSLDSVSVSVSVSGLRNNNNNSATTEAESIRSSESSGSSVSVSGSVCGTSAAASAMVSAASAASAASVDRPEPQTSSSFLSSMLTKAQNVLSASSASSASSGFSDEHAGTLQLDLSKQTYSQLNGSGFGSLQTPTTPQTPTSPTTPRSGTGKTPEIISYRRKPRSKNNSLSGDLTGNGSGNGSGSTKPNSTSTSVSSFTSSSASASASYTTNSNPEIPDSLNQPQLLKLAQTHPLPKLPFAQEKRNREFHDLFKSVPADDRLVDDFSCALSREVLLQGRLYVSENYICFVSGLFGWARHLVLSLEDVVKFEKRATAGLFPNGIMVETRLGQHYFANFLSRDSTFEFLVDVWVYSKRMRDTWREVSGGGVGGVESGVDGGVDGVGNVGNVNGGVNDDGVGKIELGIENGSSDKIDTETDGSALNSASGSGKPTKSSRLSALGTAFGAGLGLSTGLSLGNGSTVDIAASGEAEPVAESVAERISERVAERGAEREAEREAERIADSDAESTQKESVDGEKSSKIDERSEISNPQKSNLSKKEEMPKSAPQTAPPPPSEFDFDPSTNKELIILEKEIPAPLSAVAQTIFGPDSAFTREYLGKVDSFDIEPIPSFSNGIRKFQYRKRLHFPVGPKQTRVKVTEKAENLYCDWPVHVISTTSSPDVPSGNAFLVNTRYQICGAAGKTRLLVSSYMTWTGSSWVKGMIESRTRDAQKEAGVVFGTLLDEWAEKMAELGKETEKMAESEGIEKVSEKEMEISIEGRHSPIRQAEPQLELVQKQEIPPTPPPKLFVPVAKAKAEVAQIVAAEVETAEAAVGFIGRIIKIVAENVAKIVAQIVAQLGSPISIIVALLFIILATQFYVIQRIDGTTEQFSITIPSHSNIFDVRSADWWRNAELTQREEEELWRWISHRMGISETECRNYWAGTEMEMEAHHMTKEELADYVNKMEQRLDILKEYVKEAGN